MVTSRISSRCRAPAKTAALAHAAAPASIARDPLQHAFGNRAIARTLPDRTAPPVVHDVLRSSGEPLEHATRAAMESRFDTDFSTVRVHTGDSAATSARAVNALAYTVGRDVVLGDAPSPRTTPGMRVLAHELAHVVQQRHAASPPSGEIALGERGDAFERDARAGVPRERAATHSLQRWEAWDRFWGGGTFLPPELRGYLTYLDIANETEGNYDSDNKARAVVQRWISGEPGFQATDINARQKALLVQEMIEGFTGDDDESAILALLTGSSDGDVATILGRNPVDVLRDNLHGEERDQLETFLRLYEQRTGRRTPTDLMAGTRVVDSTTRANVEQILNPGSTIVGGVVVPGPAMTGLPPVPGVDGPFATAMRAVLLANVTGWATRFRAQRARGAILPRERISNLATTAQSVTESHFAPYVRGASRSAADWYHPGSYTVMNIIEEQSSVPIADGGSTVGGRQYPGRRGWTAYWMQHQGRAVMDTYHCDISRPDDMAEFVRVRDSFVSANESDINDAIHGWPAEASGGIIKMQPFGDATTSDEIRRFRWDAFTTLIHEMMHVLQHPNYKNTYSRIGGSGMEILKEGMADVMRHDVWDSTAGNLSGRLATPEYAPIRREVENGKYPYDSSVVQEHSYYPETTAAQNIVFGSGVGPGRTTGVGMANAKAAFFLGHTELLGLGAGTRTSGGSLAGLATYDPSDVANAGVYVIEAGDTIDTVRARTNAAPGGIRDGAGNVITAIPAVGTQVHIAGIRWVRAIASDTLGTVADQNNVSMAALAAANRLPAGSPASTPFAAGTRILIPIH